MPQINQGLRSVLSIPAIYSLFSRLVGSERAYKIFVKEYVRPQKGDTILDISCGLEDIISYLPSVEYIGFDLSQKYIDTAKKRFGDRATFICEKVSTSSLKKTSYFDLVLAVGVLHHLDNSEALQLFQLAQKGLKPGGKLITYDGVYVKNQSPYARWIISQDRGQNIRTKQGYLDLASQIFSDITVSIRHDLLNLPYTHIILQCKR